MAVLSHEVADGTLKQWLTQVSAESRLLRWVACSDLSALHDQFLADTSRRWAENSGFAYWWQTVEDSVLAVMQEAARCATCSHLSLHFDGFAIVRDKKPVPTQEEFKSCMEQRVFVKTRVRITLTVKRPISFLSGIMEGCAAPPL